MTAEEKAKVGPGCVLMSSALGAGGGGCGLDQRRMSAFLGECVEPSSLRGSRLGRQASSGSVCVHVPSRPVPPPQEVATYPAGGTGVVVVSFLLHFGFSIAQLMLLKEFLMCLLLKVSVLHAGFFPWKRFPSKWAHVLLYFSYKNF